jgi:ABC-type thiamin/hydroxymethylpyrimidine transport system permease subunit
MRTRELTTIALVAVLVLVAKTVLRMPIKVSGHAGVLWIAALIVGRYVVRRPGAATLMGFIGGTLIAIFQPGDAGAMFTVAKYVLPGLVLDVLAPLLDDRFDRAIPAMLAGGLAHASKVAVDLVEGHIAGLRGPLLFTGLTISLVLHIAFGALGGLVAALALRTLIKAEVPQVIAAGNEVEPR